MNIQRRLSRLLSFVGALSLLIACVFLGAAVYSSATIPSGQVNEAMLGYFLAVASGAIGAVLLAVAFALRTKQRVSP